MIEHRSVSGEERGRYLFYPMHWSRRVRQYGEFAVVIQIKDDLITRIALMHQPIDKPRKIETYDDFESLKKALDEISDSTGIFQNPKQVEEIKKKCDYYEYHPDINSDKLYN